MKTFNCFRVAILVLYIFFNVNCFSQAPKNEFINCVLRFDKDEVIVREIFVLYDDEDLIIMNTVGTTKFVSKNNNIYLDLKNSFILGDAILASHKIIDSISNLPDPVLKKSIILDTVNFISVFGSGKKRVQTTSKAILSVESDYTRNKKRYNWSGKWLVFCLDFEIVEGEDEKGQFRNFDPKDILIRKNHFGELLRIITLYINQFN